MTPHLGKVDEALEPGLILLSWTSINIDSFMEKVYKAIGKEMLILETISSFINLKYHMSDTGGSSRLSAFLIKKRNS